MSENIDTHHKKWEGMLKRTATGAVLTIVSLAVVLCAEYPFVLPLVTLALSMTAVFELIRAAHFTQERGFTIGIMALAAAVSLIPIPHYGDILIGIMVVGILVFGHIMRRNSRCILDTKPRTAGVCVLVILLLRAIPELGALEDCRWYLGLSLLICYATDALAYLGGKAFGRHKLCPKISPNKTVEGSLFGIAGAVLGALILNALHPADLPLLIVYAVCASIAGQFGDLAISGVKRAFAVKDLGRILPGHGGILDRFDSHMFTVPFTLLFCRITGGFF